MPPFAGPPRILILRVGAMGDILHALPAVAALRRALPAAEIGWAVEPHWRPLLESADGDRPLGLTLHPAETRLWKETPVSRRTLRSLLTLRSDLQARRYTHAVDLQGSLRSAAIGWLAHAGTLAGSATPRETPARLLYHLRLPTHAAHVVEQAAELLGAALGLPLAPAPVPLPRDRDAELWAISLLRSPRPSILLVPQAGWGAKQWPATHFAALARQLAGHGFTPLVNSTGDTTGNTTGNQDPLARAVVEASAGTARAIHASLPQLIALSRRVALVVAGDTGPLHLAAALGRPVVALFGPTDPARTGPFATASRIFRHPGSRTDHRRHSAAEAGLTQLTVEPVLAAALDLLAATPPSGDPIGDNNPMPATTRDRPAPAVPIQAGPTQATPTQEPA